MNWKAAAELKTISDYAKILELLNGFSQEESLKYASESQGENLYEELLRRNEELFKTGDIILQ